MQVFCFLLFRHVSFHNMPLTCLKENHTIPYKNWEVPSLNNWGKSYFIVNCKNANKPVKTWRFFPYRLSTFVVPSLSCDGCNLTQHTLPGGKCAHLTSSLMRVGSSRDVGFQIEVSNEEGKGTESTFNRACSWPLPHQHPGKNL